MCLYNIHLLQIKFFVFNTWQVSVKNILILNITYLTQSKACNNNDKSYNDFNKAKCFFENMK